MLMEILRVLGFFLDFFLIIIFESVSYKKICFKLPS